MLYFLISDCKRYTFLFPNNFSPSKKIFRVCALKKLCKNNIVIFFPTKYRQRKKLCNQLIYYLIIVQYVKKLIHYFQSTNTSITNLQKSYNFTKSLRKYNAKRGCNLLQENALPYETRYSISKHVSQTKS